MEERTKKDPPPSKRADESDRRVLCVLWRELERERERERNLFILHSQKEDLWMSV